MMEDTGVIRDKYHPLYAASDVTFPENNVANESCADITISIRTDSLEPESSEVDTYKKKANK